LKLRVSWPEVDRRRLPGEVNRRQESVGKKGKAEGRNVLAAHGTSVKEPNVCFVEVRAEWGMRRGAGG